MPKKVCEHVEKIHEFIENRKRTQKQKGAEGSEDNFYHTNDIVRILELNPTNTYGDSLAFNIIIQLDRCECENVEDLKRRISELEASSSNQLVLRRNVETDLSVVRTEKNNLQQRVYYLESSNQSLESRNGDLQRERDNYQSLVRAGERELITKNNQITEKDRQITTYSMQLTTAQNQLTTIRNELTTVSNQKQARIDELTRQLATLQITNNNISREIAEKKNEIKNLKGELGQSREEFLGQKVELKDEKLSNFIQQIGANRQVVYNLRGYYEALSNARKNYNQTNIRTAENNIENVKQQFLNGGINVANTQKLCRKCEKITKLKLELEQILQQQYEARQEVPPR